jgi:hypothetical protein
MLQASLLMCTQALRSAQTGSKPEHHLIWKGSQLTWFARWLVLFASLGMLTGCGSKGDSAPAPTDFAVTAADGRATLTWTMAPGVEYWVFYAPTSSITPTSWTSFPGAKSLLTAQSPATISGLVNGTTYAFTINGRTDGGPGGPGAPSVAIVPRLAGATWTAGSPINSGAQDLNAATSGTVGGNIFMAVGNAGTIASSPDGIVWTTLSNTAAPTANLNAVAFGGSGYVAAGAGGVILNSVDGLTWGAQASPTSNAINALATNGADVYVGVGAAGTIVYSYGGISWSLVTSGTANDLLAVAYGNGIYVAVDSTGALLTSLDGGLSWATTSATGLTLKSVAYGASTDPVTLVSTPLFVAVGASGALVTSPDGSTWTSSPGPVHGGNINSITYGTQFVMVGDSVLIYTSSTGTTWQRQASG